MEPVLSPETLPILITISDAVRLFGVGRTKLYELIGAGDIEARKVGARTLIVVASLMAWLDTLPSARVAVPRKA